MSDLIHAWGTWCRFSTLERRQWLGAWLWLPFVSFGLRFFGLRRVRAMLRTFLPQTPSRVDLPAARSLARIFYSAVHRSILPPTCLAQSLVLDWMLRHDGLVAQVRIGVARQDGRFAAHAWVEHSGAALEEKELRSQFAALEIAPSQGRDA